MIVINMEKGPHAQAHTKQVMSWEMRLPIVHPSRPVAGSQLRESQSLVKGLRLVRRAGNWPKGMNYSEFSLN